MAFTVLFVCTGNVCRSPAAEMLFRRAVRPAVTGSSAGLNALIGDPVDGPTAMALRLAGVEPTLHRARQVHPALVAASDLVLTAESDQRDRLMTEFPSAFRRTFTLKEFTRVAVDPIVRAHAVVDPRQVVELVSQNRGVRRPTEDRSEDIHDTYGASFGEASAMVVEVGAQIDILVRVLGVRRPRPSLLPHRAITRLRSG